MKVILWIWSFKGKITFLKDSDCMCKCSQCSGFPLHKWLALNTYTCIQAGRAHTVGQRFVSVLFSHTESGHSRVLNNFHSCLILHGNLYSFLSLLLPTSKSHLINRNSGFSSVFTSGLSCLPQTKNTSMRMKITVLRIHIILQLNCPNKKYIVNGKCNLLSE